MTTPQRSGVYDWNQAPEPAGLERWVADHRVLVRTVLIVCDASIVAILVVGLTSGDNSWYNYLQLLLWGWLTVNFGWVMPRSVDAWRRRQDESV